MGEPRMEKGMGEEVYEPLSGENIHTTVAHMIDLANTTRGRVRADFNGIDLAVTENSTVEEVVNDFYRKSTKRREANADREQHEKQEQQREAHALIAQLSTLNFNDLNAVLDWTCALQAVDAIVDETGSRVVLEKFSEHGYQPGMNRKEAFDAEDRDNVAGFIIGQMLAAVRDHDAIPRPIRAATSGWKKKFAS